MCYATAFHYEPEPIRFHVNRPFIYFICNKQGAVLFGGKMIEI